MRELGLARPHPIPDFKHGEQVNEIERPKRPKRRMGAKNDTIDAVVPPAKQLLLERINPPCSSTAVVMPSPQPTWPW